MKRRNTNIQYVKAYVRRAPGTPKRKASTRKPMTSKNKANPAAVALVVLTTFLAVKAVFAAEGTETFTFDRPELVQVVEATPEPEAPAPAPAPKAAPAKVANLTSQPTKEQKDATERVCRKIAANRAEHYQDDGISPELFTTTCYYDLLAIALSESRFNCASVGDQGRSRGCFQIQTKLHNVSVEDAENYEWAAEWTMDRMVRDTNYPHLRTASIRRHNGAGEAAEIYAEAVKSRSAAFERMGL